MLYHVRISLEDESSDETKIDMSEDELDSMVLKPYRTGEPITLNGRVIQLNKVTRIRISRSEESAESLYPRLKAEDQRSSVVVLGGPSYAWRAAGRLEDVTDQYITGPPGRATPQAQQADNDVREVAQPSSERGATGNRVFVVSGRDSTARNAVTAVMQSLGLTIVEWEHAVAATGIPNPYVGEVVEAGLHMADAAVVILTPDDVVKLRNDLLSDDDGAAEREARGQARPNVIYEAGFADALGRDRTVIVEVGNVKPFSDAVGRHTIRYDGSAAKRNVLADRLAIAGLEVNKTGEEWLRVGDAAAAVEAAEAALGRTVDEDSAP